MSEKARRRALRQLGWAEGAGRCLDAPSEKDRRLLRRLAPDVLEPLPRLFARRSHWERLTPDRRTLHLMRGLARQHPDWVFCGTSAALAHGLPVSWRLLTHVEVTGANARSTPGLRARQLRDVETCRTRGLLVTDLWRTVFDCLVELPAPDALAIADAALRKTGWTPGQLSRYLGERHRGERGVERARLIAAFADGRAESGGESIARALMIELGFSLPELQVWIEDPVSPGSWFRADFAWFGADGALILGEMDGHGKSTQPELMGGRSAVRVLQDERLRESHLTALQPKIVRFSYDGLLDRERFAALLDSFGVPRRDVLFPEPPHLTTSRAILMPDADFGLMLVSEMHAA